MANKGLKEYTKQISQTIGDVAKVSVNVNKEDANMHILIPLFQTLGPNPMDLSLIWNYQNRDRIGHFGKGCNLNTYKEISDNESYISVKEADGGYTSYWDKKGLNNFTADENNITIVKHTIFIPGDSDEYTYDFKDPQGNKICYEHGNAYYPTSIVFANGEQTIFDGMNMDNGHGAKVTFTGSNQLKTRATYTQDGVVLSYVDFIYDSNQRLKEVKQYKETKLIKHISITYSSNEIMVKDVISMDYAKYTFTEQCVTKISEVINDNIENLVQTTISYEDRRTTLTDNDGRKVYLYYDKNNFPLFEIDEDGNAVETKFDATTKRLTSESSTIPTKKKMTTLSTPNISLFTKTSGITTSIAKVSDSVLSSILDPVFYVSGTGSLTFSIPTKGLGSDTITAVIWGKQWSSYSSTSNVKVSLTVDGTDSDEFKKTITDGNFEFMTLGVTAIKSYSTIKLKITLKGNASIEIGGIQILKKDFGAFYQYDENGNVTETESGKGSTLHVYNTKGFQTRSVGKDSAMYDYEYDEKGNLVTAKTAFGGEIENTYDSHNNVTKSVATNADGTKKLETSKSYDSNGRFLISETDELGNKTSYTYDSFGKLKKIKNALSVTTEYSYDAFDNLTKILFDNSISVNYTYDSQGKLETATLPNGTIYSFTYDASNNLNSVSMNNVLVVSFSYDKKTGLITQQKYGESGETFIFVYDKKHNISQIRINGILKYQYIYDDYEQLIQVKNGSEAVLKSYTYDNDGQLTKAIEEDSTLEYSYDSLGTVNQRKRTLNSKTIYESFDSISRSKGFSPDNLIGYLQGNIYFLGSMFSGNSDIKNATYICKPYDYKANAESKLTYNRKDVIPCVYCGLSNPMSYNPPLAKQNVEDSGCLGFWFYLSSIPASGKKKYLFSLKHKTLSSYVAVYLNSSSKLVLEVRDTSNVIETRELNSYVDLFKWHFFGLSFIYRDGELGTTRTFSYELYHNADCLKGNITNKTILTGSVTPYHIGYRFDGTAGYDELGCYITGLMIGCRTQISTKQMQEYYSVSKDYILGTSYLDGASVDFSAASVHNLSEQMLEKFEIYPLHNSVESLTGIKPLAYDVRRISITDKDRSFNYNNKIKRYAYVADEGRLEYTLNMSTDGTVLMRAFIREKAEKQYFFELKDTDGRKLGLYRGKDSYLYMHHNDTILKTTLQFNIESWHTIGISFKSTSSSASAGSYETIRVYLDGKTYSTNLSNVIFKSFTLSVGRLFDAQFIEDSNLGSYSTYYPLLGQIEMLATCAEFCEVSTLNTLSNELEDTTKVSEYDELGLLNRKVIKAKEEILSTEYDYKTKTENKTPDNYKEIECTVSHVEQLIEIEPNGRYTFAENEVYIGYIQDVQEINPDLYHTKVTWGISEDAYEEFGDEGQVAYDHMDQAFMFFENKIWTNTTNYRIIIVDLGYQYDTDEKSTYISPILRQETYRISGGNNIVRSYKTDVLGNVTSITDNTFGSHSYSYNARGFLTKEDSTVYAYDSNGNITKAGSTKFTYDSIIKDRLKAVNGKEITYGNNPLNPISYDGITFEWEGRRLIKYNNYMYTYNDQGLRTSKTISNVTTKYYYDGDKLITEVTPTSQLDFLYDENQQLYGFIYNNNEKYFYIRDFVQNILGIVDTNGSLVVKYRYTAYGKITSITGSLANTIGAYNPFRYKGYYYDTETKMYYCKSRYYNPEWCRWLNGDSASYLDIQTINGMNLFNYCHNSPIMYMDENGNFGILAGILLAIVGSLVSGAINGLAAMGSKEEDESNLGAFLGGFIDGAVGTLAVAAGVATGGGAGIAIAAGFSFLGGFLGNMTSQYISYGDFQPLPAFVQGGYSAVVNGFMCAGFSTAGLTNSTKWIERFCNIAGFSVFGVSVSSYFAYYSLNANKLRKKKIINKEGK